MPLSPPSLKPWLGPWNGRLSIVLLPPKLPGTAAPSPFISPSFSTSLFKFGVLEVLWIAGDSEESSCARGEECTGLLECCDWGWETWLLESVSPRVEVRGETRPVCGGWVSEVLGRWVSMIWYGGKLKEGGKEVKRSRWWYADIY